MRALKARDAKLSASLLVASIVGLSYVLHDGACVLATNGDSASTTSGASAEGTSARVRVAVGRTYSCTYVQYALYRQYVQSCLLLYSCILRVND